MKLKFINFAIENKAKNNYLYFNHFLKISYYGIFN